MKNYIHFSFLVFLWISSCSFSGEDIGSDSSSNGSTSRFATHNNFMYTLNHNQIKIFNITDATNPILEKVIKIDDELQTITVYKEKLYVGAQRGIYVVDITTPLLAKVEATITHWIAKDPVAITEPYLYSTTRNNFQGQLSVYEDKGNYQFDLLNVISLSQPYGLGIKDDYLFVCDDIDGILIFNISQRNQPIEANRYSTIISPRDVIILGEVMICSAKNEFQLLDIKDPRNPRLIDVIK